MAYDTRRGGWSIYESGGVQGGWEHGLNYGPRTVSGIPIHADQCADNVRQLMVGGWLWTMMMISTMVRTTVTDG